VEKNIKHAYIQVMTYIQALIERVEQGFIENNKKSYELKIGFNT
jgi:hypothetical protein